MINNKCIPQAFSLVLISQAMLFLGFFLKQSVDRGIFDWREMLPFALAAIAGMIWSLWIYLGAVFEGQKLRRELIDVQDQLQKAQKKTSPPPVVISANAPSKDRPRKPSWRTN